MSLCVCVTGRTARLEVYKTEDSHSRSVQQLCRVHAKCRPTEYWLSFLQKLLEAGIEPSSQLTMKLSAWLKWSMTAVCRSVVDADDERCATTACCQRPFGMDLFCWSCLRGRQPAQSQKCCSSGCQNMSLTRFGLCLLCRSPYSVIARLATSQLGKRRKARACGYSQSLLQPTCDASGLLASDAVTGKRCETVGGRSVHDAERDSSIEQVTPVEQMSPMMTVHRVKPRWSLLRSEMSASSGVQSDQPVNATACIAPVCINEGLDRYRGLCAACHTVLVKVNSQRHRMSASYGL